MSTRSKTVLCSLLCFAFVALAEPRSAAADTSAADSAAAQVLFDDAVRLMKSGKPAEIEQACPKLVESQRLDPGIGTLLNLGICYEAAGKTASSYGAYGDAAVMARNAGDKARQDESERRAKVMEARLSKLVVSVAITSRTPGLTVKRDGREVAEALWGAALPVDPGEHAIEAAAPGKKTWTGSARVPSTSGSMTVEIPALEAAPVVVSGPAGGEVEPPASGWSSQRKAGVIIGSVGLAGVVVGSVFGLLVGGKKSDSAAHCQVAQPNICDSEGVALREDAYTFANVSNAMFAVGGAAVIGGVVVFLTAPSEKKAAPSGAARRIEVRPAVTIGTAGLMLRGEW